MRGKMCKQRTALDMLIAQPDKGGLSDAAILLHKKQCDDTEELSQKIDGIEKKVDKIIAKLDEKNASTQIVLKVLDNRMVQIIILVIIATILGSNYLIDFLHILQK